jgi:uncharacterized membrane protein YidH (DUF202 family)
VDSEPPATTPRAPGPGTNPEGEAAPRRTSLAAERTWLAWWRTGLAASAVALAVGRFLPSVSSGPHWPSRALGVAYGVLAIAVFVMGARRQRDAADAIRRGGFDELSSELVLALTTAGVLLAVATIAVVTISF